MSRVLNLRVPENSEPLRLQGLLAETRGRLRSCLPASVAVQTRIEPGVGPVRVDPEALAGVLVALVRGAERQGGVLTLALDQVLLASQEASPLALAAGAYARLEVTDTGLEVDEADVPRLLEPLLPPPGPDAATPGEGVVEVEGLPSRGTALRFYLPLCLEPSPQFPADPLPPSPRCSRKSERILFVDDEGALARMGARVLGRLGYRVVESVDPQAALEEFLRDPRDWDLVVTDQSMPGMTGARLVAEIRRLRPNLPAVLCAGSSRGLDQGDPEVAGFDEFLFKPVSAEVMGEVVRRVLDQGGRSAAHANPSGPASGQPESQAPDQAAGGLDMAEGLSRVMGDEELYQDLLARFVASHRQAAHRIRSAWHTGDLTKAADLAHGLKGVSSTLGATGVSSLAARLEESFWAGGDTATVEPTLESLEEALAEVSRAIQARLPEGGRSTRAGLDLNRFEAVCRQLEQYLKDSDPEAGSLFTREAALFEAALGSDHAALQRSIRDFDYDEALARLPDALRRAGRPVPEDEE